ncbi:hypothetical protein N7520_007245 [Penicillium odoratum]|uniref:uncharacterized protein n=1 Tax=Penicillium odoratum TaxID=1167516 RepID=UPI002547781B|nr:uncharacterized protein N7520_007245 [Penicillium odoratum]KAJ5760089.1 hypothetical protein N7520_007245 [Penicillium odoratum]
MASELNPFEAIGSAYLELGEQDSPRWKRQHKMKSAADQLLYFGVSNFKHAKPDLTLHRGTSANAPVVAKSKHLKLSSHFKLALEDFDDVDFIQWEDMTRES